MKMLIKIYHFLLALFFSVFYGNPSKDMTVIGVTGTKGKTTSAHLIYHLLQISGRKTAILSSNRVAIGEGGEVNKTGNTMPGRWYIQRFLKKARGAGCKYAILEVTSQGVEQYRHRFIKWDLAAFTTLHPEHIEAHGSLEKYREAKLKFFRYVRDTNKEAVFFINRDDDNSKKFEEAAGEKLVWYSGKEASVKIETLSGELNKPNIALAEKIGEELGISRERIENALKNFPGLAGRMEIVQRQPFMVVVDYAYTPESVELAYRELASKKGSEKNSLITVFGSAGGGRDKWKRPRLGEIAEKYAQKIILTTEEPYDEDPREIIEDIEEGIKNKGKVEIIIDRRGAIERAVEEAREGDVVALLGKGAEPYIQERRKKIPWSEREVVLEILRKKCP